MGHDLPIPLLVYVPIEYGGYRFRGHHPRTAREPHHTIGWQAIQGLVATVEESCFLGVSLRESQTQTMPFILVNLNL